MRLAGVGALWGAATLFHAYHDGAARSWQQALEAAITAVAIAPDRAAVHAILRGLVVGLADNHAAVTHPMALVDGMLPMAFRRFGDRIVVAGTVAQLAGDVIAGDELIAIDDVPARIAYTRAAGVTSAATPGYHELASLVRMSRGPRGAIRTLVLQRAPGQTTTRYFPLVSYAAYDHQVLGPRPKTGSEVAPGVYYVDIEELTTATWTKLVTGLRSARSVIVDLRGYSASIMAVLASFLTQEIASPVWCIPVRPRAAFAGCVKSRWSVRPAADHLTARLLVLVDAHTTSAMETALQMIVDHGLATTLGETSGGTNGNIANVQLPGGFEARFTGMRAERPDGSTIHGRGIVPDVVVHPTLAGLRAGRDEILEAAIARAQAP